MTTYGKSPWLDRFPASRVPRHRSHNGSTQADVVVVGGGLTGCAAAYAFAVAGVKVVLLEANQIGRAGTAASLGWISDDPDVGFLESEKAMGLRAARLAFQSWRRAALDFSALLRRLDVKCHLQAPPAVTVAITADQATRLKREQKARLGVGLGVPFLAPRAIASELAIDASAGLRDKDSAVVDPYRACLGIASAAEERGAKIFERSPVTRVTFGRRAAEVITAGGSIRTGRVVVATGIPTVLYKSLRRHFWFRTSYLAQTDPVPAKIRQRLGNRAAVLRDSASPAHVVRWVDDDRMMISGADAESAPDRLREKVVVQRTGQLMYELSTLYPDISGLRPAYGWDAPYARTADDLPYIGPHRNFPHHLFAFGDASRSVTGAYLASRILLRYLLDESESADLVFEFTRHGR